MDTSTCISNLGLDQANAGLNVTSNMFCAGVAAGGVDTCQVSNPIPCQITNIKISLLQGDSGGPAISTHYTSTFYEIYGVTSWGVGCGRANSPGVYASVRGQFTAVSTVTFVL